MVRRGQSCRLLDWTAPRWSRPQLQGGGCSSEIQLLERMKFVVISRSNYQHVGQRVDNVERDLQVGLESQKWGWQLDYEWFYTNERVYCLFSVGRTYANVGTASFLWHWKSVHSSYVWTLDNIKFGRYLNMWMDTKLWSSTLTEDEHELCRQKFKRLGVTLDVSLKKAKCVVCLFRTAIYVRFPW